MQFKQRTVIIRLRGGAARGTLAISGGLSSPPPAVLMSPEKNLSEEIKRSVITERRFNKSRASPQKNRAHGLTSEQMRDEGIGGEPRDAILR